MRYLDTRVSIIMHKKAGHLPKVWQIQWIHDPHGFPLGKTFQKSSCFVNHNHTLV